MQCVYCKAEHFSASCEKVNSCEQVNTVSTRMAVLKREGRCFLCLSSGHRVSEFSVNRRWHHQSLCEQTVALEPPKETTSSQEGIDKYTVNVTTVARCKTEVLLQTACTFAYTANEGLIPVRILMVTGSQRLYL